MEHEALHYYTEDEASFLVDVYDHETREVWDRLTAQDIIDAGLLRRGEDDPVFIDVIIDAKGLVQWEETDEV